MGLEFSPAAAADLVAIASFIACDNVPRAVTFVDELEGACAKIADFPLSGVARPEIRAGLRSKPARQLCHILQRFGFGHPH
ncbi:type II toxin-antitoxin system RelE/ParE family toxin [Sphingobium estronivorans]|uniref:type II toxin-antitoxin system RelE/ParE family toxin n=1 Tax=Sphingobium estronivorans TaxID=1577690 RepID=UPI001F0840D3|nr:type II toxin-antitoxin system RelE/ParE family toxin [Sphingobium estronivorans]